MPIFKGPVIINYNEGVSRIVRDDDPRPNGIRLVMNPLDGNEFKRATRLLINLRLASGRIWVDGFISKSHQVPVIVITNAGRESVSPAVVGIRGRMEAAATVTTEKRGSRVAGSTASSGRVKASSVGSKGAKKKQGAAKSSEGNLSVSKRADRKKETTKRRSVKGASEKNR